jgi:ketopantoate reductase
MRHLDVLEARFGRDHVLGGQCVIAATLDNDHAIVHLNDSHELSYGEMSPIVARADLTARAMRRRANNRQR